VTAKALCVYISGPMTGHDGLNYERFNKIAVDLRNVGYRTRNPASIDVLWPSMCSSHNGQERCPECTEVRTYEWYLKHALHMLLEADAVATLDGWTRSKGAKIEVNLARKLKMPVAMWTVWMDRARRRHPRSMLEWS